MKTETSDLGGRLAIRGPKTHSPITLRAKNGGGERDRTDGLLVANQALSQLSYTPERSTAISSGGGAVRPFRPDMRGGPR